jgi:hypothetical protein
MANENTSTHSTGEEEVAAKSAGDTISADTFRAMIDVLEDLAGHNHIFYDDYTTVCECQCQCACSRGTL